MVTHGARAYPGFISVKRLREFLPLGQDASLSQGTLPQNAIRQLTDIQVPNYTAGLTEAISVKKLAQDFYRDRELNPGPLACETSVLTVTPCGHTNFDLKSGNSRKFSESHDDVRLR